MQSQVAMNFDQTGFSSTTQTRKRIIRTGAKARYNEALEYLREELKSGKYERLESDEFANTFKITSSFLHLVTAIGGMNCIRHKGKQGLAYSATSKLATITGKDLLDFRLSEHPNPPYEPEPAPFVPQHLLDKTPEQRKAFVKTMNEYQPNS